MGGRYDWTCASRRRGTGGVHRAGAGLSIAPRTSRPSTRRQAKGNWTEAQKAAVTKLRDEGDALHKAGKHKESVDKLAEAMRAMRNSM